MSSSSSSSETTVLVPSRSIGRPSIVLALTLLVVASCGKSDKKDEPDPDKGDTPQTQTQTQTQAPKDPREATQETLDKLDKPLPADDAFTWFRVVVESEQAPEVPFFVGVHGDGTAVVANGDERMRAQGKLTDTELDVYFPVIGTRLSMKKDGDGYKGQWLASFYFKQDFTAWAEPVDRPSPQARFPEADAPPAEGVDVSGTWVADIELFGTAGASFEQMPDGSVRGSIVPADVGDTRFLSGKVSGKKLYASSFDAMHSYLVEAELQDDGTLKGAWSYTGIGHWPFEARRGELPAMNNFVTVKTIDNARTVTIAELDKPPYKGNPVIVDYFGTWCPACMDLTPQLIRLHDKYKDQGLQILAIALEVETERELVLDRIEEYKAMYNIPWKIDVRLVENFNDELPIEFEDVEGFPLTLFLRRDHTLAGMSTAFVSEAAPAEHKAMVAQFEAWTKEIVESKAAEGAPGGATENE